MKIDTKHAKGSWPFPDANGPRAGDGPNLTWWEISADVAEKLLQAVPPYYIEGHPDCFAVGEPADHAPNGAPIHALVAQRGSRYFLRETVLSGVVIEAVLKGLDVALAVSAQGVQP